MAQVGKRTSLSRSTGGTVVIFAFLIIMGAFMLLPLIMLLLRHSSRWMRFWRIRQNFLCGIRP